MKLHFQAPAPENISSRKRDIVWNSRFILYHKQDQRFLPFPFSDVRARSVWDPWGTDAVSLGLCRNGRWCCVLGGDTGLCVDSEAIREEPGVVVDCSLRPGSVEIKRAAFGRLFVVIPVDKWRYIFCEVTHESRGGYSVRTEVSHPGAAAIIWSHHSANFTVSTPFPELDHGMLLYSMGL